MGCLPLYPQFSEIYTVHVDVSVLEHANKPDGLLNVFFLSGSKWCVLVNLNYGIVSYCLISCCEGLGTSL